MGEIIPIHAPRIFTQGEAEDLLPIIRRLTERSVEAVRRVQEQMQFVPQEEPLYARLFAKVESVVQGWAQKISRLGCQPRGIWLVDFETEGGWLSWRLGDDRIAFFHTHKSPIDALRVTRSQRISPLTAEEELP